MWGSHCKIPNVNFSSHLFHFSKFDASEYMMTQCTPRYPVHAGFQHWSSLMSGTTPLCGQKTECRRPAMGAAVGAAMKRVSIAVTRAMTSCCSWYSSWRSNWKSFVFGGWKVGFNFQTCLNNLIIPSNFHHHHHHTHPISFYYSYIYIYSYAICVCIYSSSMKASVWNKQNATRCMPLSFSLQFCTQLLERCRGRRRWHFARNLWWSTKVWSVRNFHKPQRTTRMVGPFFWTNESLLAKDVTCLSPHVCC